MTSRHRELDGIFLARPQGAEDVASGMRLAVKDLFDTAGLVTTYGSILFADHVPATSAEAVRRAEAAGWVDVGKTNLHEFAYGTTSENPHFGTVPNPLATGRLAGGSSGGSAAAIAAGLADAALGTDSGGSIRIPSACCGTTGFKPTYGLVPLDGCFPLAPSFDHAGPMAADVDGCVELLRALVPEFDATELGLEDVEVGVAWTELADPLVRARVEAAAELFPRRRKLDVPFPEGLAAVFMREAADVHRELFEEHADCVRRERARQARALPGGDRRRVRAGSRGPRALPRAAARSGRARSTCCSLRRSPASRRARARTSSRYARR